MQSLLPQYEFIALIGRGGMGAVYKARQKSLDRIVAIKVLPGDILDENDANFVQRFQNEAKTMARMNHPAIVDVYDFGETREHLLYFVMEYVEGTDVADLVKARGKLSPQVALTIAAHVCDALSYAHNRGVIHRDIKPANVLIDRDGQVKVADFGLAKAVDQDGLSGLTSTRMTMGTPDYAAPEALMLGISADHRADLYAVGVMLYHMLTGEIPRGRFKGASTKVSSDPRFDDIINHAMETEREDRYQSAAEIRQDLDKILTAPLVREGELVSTAAMPKSFTLQPLKWQTLMPVEPVGTAEGHSVLPSKKASRKVLMAGGLVVAFMSMGIGSLVVWNGVKETADESLVMVEASPELKPVFSSLAEGSAGSSQAQTQPLPPSGGEDSQLNRTAALMVLSKGGKVTIEQGVERWEVWEENDLPPGSFELVGVKMGTQGGRTIPVSKTDMDMLSGLTRLEQLELYGATVVDASLSMLGKLPGLKMLALNQCKSLTDGAMVHVAGVKGLVSFAVDGSTGVGSAGLLHLMQLKKLESLHLSNLPYLDHGVLPVLLELRGLKTLHLHGCENVEKRFVESLSGLPELCEVYLSITQLASEVEMSGFKCLRTMRLYDYDAVKMMDGGMLQSLGTLPQLESLQLVRLELSEPQLETMARWPALRVLSLDEVMLPDSGLAGLAQGAIHRLEIGEGDAAVHRAALASLTGLESLKELQISYRAGLSGTEIEAFRQGRPDVMVERKK
ncbi:serine/threonine-protein kinase [Phragmitibacter flavus]|nr:serine/threonine-protein kinase [Phragmitibacter flavus]